MLNAILLIPLRTIDNHWFSIVSDNCQDSLNLVVTYVTLAYPMGTAPRTACDHVNRLY